jgi:hypothetical protein
MRTFAKTGSGQAWPGQLNKGGVSSQGTPDGPPLHSDSRFADEAFLALR